jgi:hypothetical protein
VIEAFCESRSCQTIPRQGVYHRAIMFLSLHLALAGSS